MSNLVHPAPRIPAASVAPPAIRAVNLTKQFGQRLSVDHLTFDIYPGELYALLGENGAGKTTTINMLTTLLPPTEGQFFICGLDGIKQSELVKGIFGVVSQDMAIYHELTAYENLSFIANLYDIPSAEAERRIAHSLKQATLTERANDLSGSFSSGMQRKLSIAMAVLPAPKAIFMDEPTVGLDPASRRQIWEQLASLKSQGVTILLTTHYLEEAELLADRIGIIRQGRLVIEGTIGELRDRLHHLRAIVISLSPGVAALEIDRKVGCLQDTYGRTAVIYDRLHGKLIFKQNNDVSTKDYLRAVINSLEKESLEFEDFSTGEPNLEDIFLGIQANGIIDQES